MQARKLTSIQLLLVVITMVMIFLMAARSPLDTDLWWHLRAGQATIEQGRPLLNDLFSFTRYGEHWINHSWLGQVVLYLLYHWGGWLVLGTWMALMATVSMALVYLQCEGPVGLRALALILGSVVASVVWSARPQLFSLVLVAVVAYLLYLYKWRGVDRLWLLLPVFWLWSNLHGGYALGFLLIGAAVAGEVLNHLLSQGGMTLSWRKVGRLLAWTGAAALVILINPNGLDVWRIPFQTVNVGVLQQFVSEWASPDFHQPLQQAFLWLLLATFAAMALGGKQGVDGADLVTVVGFAYLALLARRNFGPFALVAVPVLTRYATCAVEAWQGRVEWPSWAYRLWIGTPERRAGAGFRKVVNLTLAALIMFVAIAKLYIVTQPVLMDSFIRQQNPAKAADWLAQNRPNARVLNEYNWGGYLQWNLRQAPVFVDGRTDLFGDEVIGEWMALVQAAPGWEEKLSQREVEVVMLDPTRPLLSQMQEAGWTLLYQDDQAVLYGKPLKP